MFNAAYNNTKKQQILSNGYVPFIKVAGLSLLPPMMTSQKRMEIRNDKQKAIETERRLNIQRDLENFFKSYKLADVALPLSTKPCDKCLDNILFDDDGDKDISLTLLSTATVAPSNVVPLLEKDLSCFSIEAKHTEVCDDYEVINTLEDDTKLSASTVELDLTDATAEEPELVTGYLLTRSKTFILPAPSPILLKHLHERPRTSPAYYNKVPDATELHSPFVPSQCEVFYSNYEDSQTQTDCEDLTCHTNWDGNSSSNSLVQDLKEHLKNQTKEDPVTDTEVSDSACDLSHLNSSKHNHENVTVPSNSNINLKQPIFSESRSESCNDPDRSLCLDNSQSLIFSNDENEFNLIDFKSDNFDTEGVMEISPLSLESVNQSSPINYPITEIAVDEYASKTDKEQRKLREIKAAGVLTAAVKGYLVRRLKHTERVQNLIQTIRDALLCALSLHTENSESIQNSDVELHRRLIQQVSAACFEFYDIFFTLTIKEKMDLISIDRQRIKDKLNKPKSATNLKSNSNRSTPQSQRKNFNARSKKSLTPMFAA